MKFMRSYLQYALPFLLLTLLVRHIQPEGRGFLLERLQHHALLFSHARDGFGRQLARQIRSRLIPRRIDRPEVFTPRRAKLEPLLLGGFRLEVPSEFFPGVPVTQNAHGRR